jgi:hypothetical protein
MTKPLTAQQRVNRASGKVAAPKPKKPVPEPKPKKREVQVSLPGTIEEKDEELTELALVYVDVRDRRMGLTKQEKEAKEKLHDGMAAKKKTRYHDPEAKILVEIVTATEGVKVHFGGEDSDDDTEE